MYATAAARSDGLLLLTGGRDVSGTPLADVEAALAGAGQILPFEPPHFGPGATIGGAVAAGPLTGLAFDEA